MTAYQIGLLIWVIVFCAAMGGMALGRILPPLHRDDATKDVIKISMAVLGTMTALVIGFLISNANASFSARKAALLQNSSNIVQLDGLLRRYGPEGDFARETLRIYLARQMQDMFPGIRGAAPNLSDPAAAKALDDVEEQILALNPRNMRQTWLQAQALNMAGGISSSAGQISGQNQDTIPLPFLFIVVIWLSVLFASFGLFAPRHATIIVAFLFCSFSVAAGLKLVMDLDTPFGDIVHMSGFPLRISSAPMRDALTLISQP